MYDPRTFDLTAVEGLSLRAIDLHIELYRGYVEQVNKLLPLIREQSPGQPAWAKLAYDARARRLALEWNGMILHELFFESLRGPGYQLDTTGVFAEALDESFGGPEAWRRDVGEMAALRGIGWVLTARDAQTNRIFNMWVDEHHLGMAAGVQTVFALDMWEHAYLLDYRPANKANYVEAVLDNTDWTVIEARCVPAPETAGSAG